VTTPTKVAEPAEQHTLFRPPLLLGVAVLVVLLGELIVAWFTEGTPDVDIWRSFAETADRVGPIDIYSLDSAGLMVYNHPPLIGWWLQVVNAGTSLGLPFGFMIRLPSIVAHAFTALIVFQILRVRVAPKIALWSGLLVSFSPVLLIIAGFHGNNDPAMAALMIASVWLLVDRRQPLLAGLAFSLAISIKIVPVIVLPLLLVAAWALRRVPAPSENVASPARSAPPKVGPFLNNTSELVRFVVGALPVAVLLWLPVLGMAGKGFFEHVLGYNGSGFPRQWGPYKFAESLHVPGRLLDLYSGPGTYLVLALCAVLPALFIRRSPERAPAALGLCLTLFLLVSPGWAPQYTSWIAAAVFLIEFWTAATFTVVAGIVYAVLYTQWAGNKLWDYAYVTTLTKTQMAILVPAWLAVIPCVAAGLWLFLRPTRAPAPATMSAPPVADPQGIP
jgi:hypothetical protein